MSSNPTQPKFSDQGDAVSFPPEDDAEGHRFAAKGEGDEQPEGFRAAFGDGDGRHEGFRALVDAEDDDTEGHRRLVMADADDDTEGHRLASFVDGRPAGQPESADPDGFRSLADGGEDDTEGHLRVLADGQQGEGPDGIRAR